MFKGKESSNRIKLSRLVQDLLNFGVLGSLWLWGWWVSGWGGVVGGVPTHVHMPAHAHTHTHTRTCMHGKHDNFMQMACFHWIFGESLEIPYDVICMHTCMCVCACACVCTSVGGTLSPPPPPLNQSKYNST